jgi:hypothetical protein
MTEDEAKTKWCPFAMAPGASFALNRGPEGVANGRSMCLASECMAFRWDMGGWKLAQDGRGMLMRPKEADEAPEGFCGLAGRP